MWRYRRAPRQRSAPPEDRRKTAPRAISPAPRDGTDPAPAARDGDWRRPARSQSRRPGSRPTSKVSDAALFCLTPWKPRHSMLWLRLVEPLAQLLARLEEGHEFLVDRDGRAGARIAPLPGRAVLDGKSAEAPQLDAIAARQRLDDLVENDVHDALDI